MWDGDAAALLEHAASGKPRGGWRPVQILGGPGTGKTSLLVDLVLAQLRAGADPESILLLTQSKRAAGELRAAITEALLAQGDGDGGQVTREPLVRTVHSYAFAVLRLAAAAHDNPPPRLITGAEQDAVLREMLRGDIEDGARMWPKRLRPALGMVGFARELRDLMLRAAERGYGPEDLERLGRKASRPDWVAAGKFAGRYEQGMLLRSSVGMEAPTATAPALDAAELISAALDAFAIDPQLLAGERARLRCVLVDDAHHLDPQAAQVVRLLGDGTALTAIAGDGDQQVFRFRGASADFLEGLAEPGSPDRIVLTQARRYGAALANTGARIAARLPAAAPQRGPFAAETRASQVQVRVLTTPAHEAALIADTLRRAHLADGVPWDRMAVIVRSVPSSLAALRRALLAAGVPVTTAANELPLARLHGVSSLLLALRALTGAEFTGDDALALVSGPLGGADPVALRRLRRGLRRAELASGRERDSAEVLRQALLADAGPLTGLSSLSEVEARPLLRAHKVLAAGRDALADGLGVEDVLWELWHTSGLEGRWVAASARGGPAGVQADRDLDGIVALFDSAADYVDRLPAARVSAFVEYVTEQELPGETRARAAAPAAVTILSAHSAAGREWDVVAVAGVQDGLWPNLRARGTLLGTEDLVDVMDGVASAPGDGGPTVTLSRTAPLLADERRLFLVACTRARSRLLITAVESADGDMTPSRFLSGLRDSGAEGPDDTDPDGPDGPDLPEPTPDVGRMLALPALVGELRAVLCAEPAENPADPADQERRSRAATQLARLAAAGVPGAHPDQWHGLAAASTGEPLWETADGPVSLSPSNVEQLQNCTLRWLLERHGGTDGSQVSAVTGTLVHTLVQAVAGHLPEELVQEEMDKAWEQVDLGSPWYSRHELARHRQMLDAFRNWLLATRFELTESGVEVGVDVVLPSPDSALPDVQLRGRVDRLERDGDDRPVIIDVKTARNAVTKQVAEEHAQLATYQVAAAAGGFDGQAQEPGGARLVFVAKADRHGVAVERVQQPLTPERAAEWRQTIHVVAAATRGPEFTATVNDTCGHCPVSSSCPAHDSGRQVTNP
nr:ATP-dependent DNA helicase [Tomitella biformata]